jgi:hypothetical protein
MARHQLGDERLLADAGQIVGARILDGEEMAAQPSQNGPAVGVEAPRISAMIFGASGRRTRR